MVGQVKLLDKLKTINLDNFPKSVLLLGEKGCGKHTYLKLIAEKLDLPSLDITETVSFEYILEIYSRTIPSIYYIDIDKFTEKKQNVILKLLEEPPVNAYIVILCSDKSLVLNTIMNRCIIFEFERYTHQELESFVESGLDSSLICEIYNTPGQILSSNTDGINDLHKLCETIIDKIQLASYCNTLSISNKINYKDEYDKFDIYAFFNMMNYTILESYKKTSNNILVDYLKKTVEFKRKFSQDNRLDKEKLFENYLSEMWLLSR